MTVVRGCREQCRLAANEDGPQVGSRRKSGT